MAKIIVKIEKGIGKTSGKEYTKLVHYAVDDKGQEFAFGDDMFIQPNSSEESILKLTGNIKNEA